jgi:hypothetical protein
MEILDLERHLENKIKNFILERDNDVDALKSELENFFKKRVQKDIDILNPRNIAFFVCFTDTK